MRINFDRLSQLAGLPSNGSNRRGLYEGAMSPMDAVAEEAAFNPADLSEEEREDEGMGLMREDEEEREDEMYHMEMRDMREEEREDEMMHAMDEMIEVDEVMLVQELRRAKRIMNENKRRRLSESRRRNMFEAQLKQVIDEEVQNVMDEMNLTSGWVYGDRRPRNSRRGYTNQGSMMPGIGFRRR